MFINEACIKNRKDLVEMTSFLGSFLRAYDRNDDFSILVKNKGTLFVAALLLKKSGLSGKSWARIVIEDMKNCCFDVMRRRYGYYQSLLSPWTIVSACEVSSEDQKAIAHYAWTVVKPRIPHIFCYTTGEDEVLCDALWKVDASLMRGFRMEHPLGRVLVSWKDFLHLWGRRVWGASLG